MEKTKSKDSADLLIELSKKINIRKYLKRKTIDLQGKTIKVLKDSSILKADLSIHNFQIKMLREHLHKTATVILKKNGLTVNDIAVDEFELGSTDLIKGHCELLSPSSNKAYLYVIVNAEIILCAENNDVEYLHKVYETTASKMSWNDKQVPNLMDYIIFLDIPPF